MLRSFLRLRSARFPCFSVPSRFRHNMRLIQFVEGGKQRVGVETSDGGDVVDVCAGDNSIPTDMRSFLEGGEEMINKAQGVVNNGQHVLKRADIRLKAPIYNPNKIICIGMNYVDHCTEQNYPLPKEPILFSKFNNAIADPGAPIIYPDETEQLDFEVELAFIIGKTGKKIKESEAMEYVAGYTVVHDVSARDWQLKKNGGQWLIGKTFDSFCPIGPAIVTKDSLSDPHKLGIRCRVNGETMQNSSTENLVFKTEALVSFISRFVTLTPGDVVITGTPPGVGCFRKPPFYLKRGDVVECEIDEIGCISNTVQ
ncbi:oxaloacetate tautomerase fahd2, mitochondrial-like [Montipora capricornis]|uniref:oxaloacetate tautomerase fahd2, mitochondrial-like n=1 Tax=Montipora capricornis TaxID=246305 RepID=UPI0035F1336E